MTVKASRAKPRLTVEQLERAAECLKVLAHPQRLHAVQLLLARQYSVGELAEACGVPSAAMSEHLRLMQRCGFLACIKEGRHAYYEVIEPHLADILACLESKFCNATQRQGRP